MKIIFKTVKRFLSIVQAIAETRKTNLRLEQVTKKQPVLQKPKTSSRLKFPSIRKRKNQTAESPAAKPSTKLKARVLKTIRKIKTRIKTKFQPKFEKGIRERFFNFCQRFKKKPIRDSQMIVYEPKPVITLFSFIKMTSL